jgi:hypothetical protein
MTAPIIIRNPLLHLQPLDDDGLDDGALVDVSCDMSSVELGVDTPTIDVTTFCGNFSIPDEISVSATLEVTVNADTDANWSAIVGRTVRAELYDRSDATRYRTFTTVVPINPSLYGPMTPGEARTFSFDVAVLSTVEWVDVESPS